ncbi:MAG: toll/interleukin-1 receptor domain-containing protein, partial [Pseudomonadota bacterium]
MENENQYTPLRPKEFTYRAFISYSSKDRKIGERFQREIETFKIPETLRGIESPIGPIPKQVTPIFRDRWDARAAQDLDAYFEKTLNESAFLIVLCSPRAAVSEWVKKEIETFQLQGKGDRIVAVVIDGTP